MLKDLIAKNRSYRRFDNNYKIEKKTLEELISLARLSASGANLQPLKFILSCENEKNARIFEQLIWAGYLADWDGPAAKEQPAAYIIILGDTTITKTFGCDHGIAAQSILLGAVEMGLGGCMVGSIKRDKLRKKLNIPDQYEILLVIAIGKPVEKIVIDPAKDGNIKYWRDANSIHHVPKRGLDELIIDTASTLYNSKIGLDNG
ncbi:MAG: nitroreductase family protein [Phycisphaerae bacterium]|nr:nitroreductase family protein [Phycisphaerae bacterium]